jgi:hypothetical protein
MDRRLSGAAKDGWAAMIDSARQANANARRERALNESSV